MKKLLSVFLVVILSIALFNTVGIAKTGTPQLTSLTASEIMQKFMDAGFPLKNITEYTEETDLNKLLGRPGQYTSKVNSSDSRCDNTTASDPSDVVVEVFNNIEDCHTRETFLTNIGLATLEQYVFPYGNVLLRVSFSLLPAEAEEYNQALISIVSGKAPIHFSTGTPSPAEPTMIPKPAVSATMDRSEPSNSLVETPTPIPTLNIDGYSEQELLTLRSRIDTRLVALGVYYQEIKKNSAGENVVALQKRLLALGYFDGDISGKWDTNSIKAMKLYEKEASLKPDGIASVGEQEILFSDNAISRPTSTPSPTQKPTATPKPTHTPKPTPTPSPTPTPKPTPSPTPSPSPSPSPKPTPMEIVEYGEGQYKVGKDIPADEYLVYATNRMVAGYFCLSSDSNGDNIIANDNFDFNSIITVKDGEYIEVSRAGLVSLKAYDSNYNLKTTESGCMLKVGTHLPAGEYKLTAIGDIPGYYCIYKSSRQDKIISNNNFSGSVYVTVKNGQYLVLTRCKIVE